jgi:hypothetical protein
VHPFGLATGGRIPGYGGGDRHLALLESGEAVVSKETTASHAATLASWGVPGFQTGGKAGTKQRGSNNIFSDIGGFFSGLFHKAADIGKITAAIFSGNTTALSNAIMDLLGHKGTGGAVAGMAQMLGGMTKTVLKDIVHFLIGQAGAGSSSAIVRFAESFIGKVPYVWGGTTPNGWDCSGFTDFVYRHFGYQPPRTSESQFGWVQRTSRPEPGGLAFFAGADGTVRNPGHVGIIVGPNRMVDAFGTGFGTRFDSIYGSSGGVSGFGVPPGGFRRPGTGLSPGNWSLTGLERLWDSAGGPPSKAHIAAAIALAESGGRPQARNASGASGLWQILGQVFPGNIFNPFINAENAVTKYRDAHGFTPWVTYLTGAYRQFMDGGGMLRQGENVLYKHTSAPEVVLNPSQTDAFLALAAAAERASAGGSSSLADAIRAMHSELAVLLKRGPAITGGAVADALNGASRQAAYRAQYSAR